MPLQFRWLNDLSQTFLDRDYLVNGQSVEERVLEIAHTVESLYPQVDSQTKFKDKFIEGMEKGWYSLSTPIWCNFGNKRGLPISCNGSYIEDSMESIAYTWSEIAIMTKHGAGTSAYFGDIRGRGMPIRDNGHSSGAVHFVQPFDMLVNTVSQGKARRGNFAPYLPIDHPDINEFLTIKTEGSKIQDVFPGVCVGDKWLNQMLAGDQDKQEIWAKIIGLRKMIGLPYIFFTDTVNSHTVDVYRDKNLKIKASNLCTEIGLPSNDRWSFVCDLASMNDLYFDEWDNTDAVKILTILLDAVMEEYIQKASKIKFMDRAVQFAIDNRALGIGQFGYHSYLQSKGVPFESMEAKILNQKISKTIQEQAWGASRELAYDLGEPPLLEGYGRRNTTLTAIAPTTSSAFIIGQASQSIEPLMSNFYIKDLAKIKVSIKNPYLEKLLREKGKDDSATWGSISLHAGSVQHLDFLTDQEKAVFKTFGEISQKEIVIQASQRQKWLDQSQSLNLMISPETKIKDINRLMLDAWELGVKTLYYQHGQNVAQNFTRDILQCKSCEG